jgi:hypothetical protein
MTQNFAQIVERVMQLSFDEKRKLLGILDELLVENTAQKANLPAAARFKEETMGQLDSEELIPETPAD